MVVTMSNEKPNLDFIDIRPAEANDVPFILSTWLKGLKYGNSWYKLIQNNVYYQVYHKVIENILLNPNTRTSVACLKEDPSVILGYMVTTEDRLHWCHVKVAWRNNGIATKLLPAGITTVTHVTDAGKAIFLKKKTWIFNPFVLS
jgi:hypothetical protein